MLAFGLRGKQRSGCRVGQQHNELRQRACVQSAKAKVAPTKKGLTSGTPLQRCAGLQLVVDAGKTAPQLYGTCKANTLRFGGQIGVTAAALTCAHLS